MATKFGGKYVFGIGVLVTSLLTLITPQMAYLNLWALVACRFVIGIFEVRCFLWRSLNYMLKSIGSDISSIECNAWEMGTTTGEECDGNYSNYRYCIVSAENSILLILKFCFQIFLCTQVCTIYTCDISSPHLMLHMQINISHFDIARIAKQVSLK